MAISKIDDGFFQGEAPRDIIFTLLVDTSGSMIGDKIASLNEVIKEAIPSMKDIARTNRQAKLKMQVIRFADRATWHVADPTEIEQFTWTDLEAGGETAMGDALQLMAGQYQLDKLPKRGMPPVMCIITDGHPTDAWESAFRALEKTPGYIHGVRVAIAMGADADQNVLRKIVGVQGENKMIHVYQANNPDQLAKLIRWVSTDLVASVHVTGDPGKAGAPAQNTPQDNEPDPDWI